ncbi:recombinase family protein [Hymenobacter nivis]|uniref:Recombinase family protein n=1 Tax=Hymenobacter nivis TaxID=1850093 RepID=A0A502GRW8_9BACT|nr:recombinase family protein [Hymenobacter nivis]TPG64614.1 recombinase family protein [Hymenobacter nivis]
MRGQTNKNRLRELRAFAQWLDYAVYKEYWDQESGESAERPQFQQLFTEAYQLRIDVVLFWSLDRFSREGITETLNHWQRLTAIGVQFESFTEQYLDSTGVFRDAIIGFLVAIAKQERVRFWSVSRRAKLGVVRHLVAR